MTRNGDLLTIDGRPTLCFERHYRHPVERVWRAVTEPSEMAAWFPSQVIGDRVVGAELNFDDDARRAADRAAGEPTRDDGVWFRGTVLAYDPPMLFEFTWGGERLRIELTPDGRATHVAPDRVRTVVSDVIEIGAWGAGDEPMGALRWDVEPTGAGTLYRLSHPAVGDDAELAATWHALLIQLDMYLAAGQLVPVEAGDWVEAYRTVL